MFRQILKQALCKILFPVIQLAAVKHTQNLLFNAAVLTKSLIQIGGKLHHSPTLLSVLLFVGLSITSRTLTSSTRVSCFRELEESFSLPKCCRSTRWLLCGNDLIKTENRTCRFVSSIKLFHLFFCKWSTN